jgi:hypothetical protein
VARSFEPFSADEMTHLRERCRSDAADGKPELFKTTTKYDGDEGRKQHQYPSSKELPA